MKIMRSKSYKFRLQEYEQMDVMSSVTVDSNDLGLSDEDVRSMSEEDMKLHVKDLGDFCNEVIVEQLKPLLEEARYLADRKSSAADVEKYNQGLGA